MIHTPARGLYRLGPRLWCWRLVWIELKSQGSFFQTNKFIRSNSLIFTEVPYFASMVKDCHSVFDLPFLISVYATSKNGTPIEIRQFGFPPRPPSQILDDCFFLLISSNRPCFDFRLFASLGSSWRLSKRQEYWLRIVQRSSSRCASMVHGFLSPMVLSFVSIPFSASAFFHPLLVLPVFSLLHPFYTHRPR